MNTPLRELVGLYAPTRQATGKEWDGVEQWLGIKLPRDYQDLAEAFGAGHFVGSLPRSTSFPLSAPVERHGTDHARRHLFPTRRKRVAVVMRRPAPTHYQTYVVMETGR
ncbi:hypothetical protein ABZY02_13795 [Streptomyces sp. NPDC006649]|uniref:hypothetical protein n=1 Tax=Streptomyces sp. NPDC006649 TaxID=3156896 RepID=UPI0033B96659